MDRGLHLLYERQMLQEQSPFGRFSAEQVASENAAFMRKVYGVMSVGLALTALTSLVVASTPAAIEAIFGNRIVFYGLLIAELAMVWGFSAIAKRVSAVVAGLLFLAYAVVNGLTMAVIFLIYTKASIATTFFATAGMFGVLSVYGLTTKRDLTGVGSLAMMGLIGLIIASVINMFLHAEILTWITSSIGVLVFVGLTAYDTQKIRDLNVIGNQGTEADHKEAIHGALTLYLDFINLFLYMLRFLGRRRD